jgi:hypothetical protein
MAVPTPAPRPWARILPLLLILAPPAPAQRTLRSAAGLLRSARMGARPKPAPFRPLAGLGRLPVAARPAVRAWSAAAGPGLPGAPGAPAGLGGDLLVRLEVKASASCVRSCGSCTLSTDLRRGQAAFWRWTVEEKDGGTLSLDADGQVRYTAPFVSSRRTFHVRASSALDGSFFGRTAIDVYPNALLTVLEPESATSEPGLALVAGGLQAARDTEDLWPLAARIARPHGVAYLPAGRRWLVTYPGNRAFFAAREDATPQRPGETPDYRDLGRSAPLSCPTDLAGNGLDGPLWRCVFAETDQDRIRVVDARGVVTPLAGEGGRHRDTGAEKHQDGPVAQARFGSPEGVAMDRDGVVYVADVGNGALRRIRAGQVTTLLAPGPGRARHAWGDRREGWKAEFPVPLNGGLALDPDAGVLYAGAGHAVLAVALAGPREGEARTLLGHPAEPGFEDWRKEPPATLAGVPCLNVPRHLAWFRGRLFISDHGNHAVREYRPDTGGLRTLAGDPKQAETRPGPLRCASPHLPPGACAALAYPMGLAFAPDGECRVATRDGVVALRGLDPAIE